MEIRIKVEGPRWLRLPRSRSGKFAVVLVCALVVAVPLGWATDRFSDVPVTNPHHNDINTIAAAGITRGCNPPANNLYCPADPVRRDQMASFLTRGLPRIAVQQTFISDFILRGPGWWNVGEVTINVPFAGPGPATQYVKVDASVNVWDTFECECAFAMRILDLTTGHQSVAGLNQSAPRSTSSQGTTHVASGVFDASPGARTYRLEMGYGSSETGADPQALRLDHLSIVATTYPFLSGSAQIDAADAQATRTSTRP